MFPVLKRYVRRQFPNTYQRLDAAMDEVRRHRVRRLRTILPLAESMSFTVQAGPFAGLRLPREAVTGSISCACLPKLLGIYEMECQKFVEELCTKSYKLVLNIGADEGYYAVGLARRIEYATVVAFETVEKSRSLCRQTAMLNRVTDRVHVWPACDVSSLASVLKDHAAIICDCEGAELDLLRPELIPALRTADMLIELHEHVVAGLSAEVLSRFSGYA